MKQEEKKVLAIIGLVFGGIALLTSWIPIINNASAVLAIVALVLGGIALLRNRKNKKVLSLVTVGIAVVSFVIVMITQATYSAVIDEAFSSSQATKKESTSEESSNTEGDTTFKVGETIVFDGEVEITITNVEWTDERNQFDDTNPEKVVKVTYNVTNLSDSDYSVGMDLDLYAGGQKMDSYPNSNTLETISKGRSYEGAVHHFGVNGDGEIEIEVKPWLSMGTDPAIVSVEL